MEGELVRDSPLISQAPASGHEIKTINDHPKVSLVNICYSSGILVMIASTIPLVSNLYGASTLFRRNSQRSADVGFFTRDERYCGPHRLCQEVIVLVSRTVYSDCTRLSTK